MYILIFDLIIISIIHQRNQMIAKKKSPDLTPIYYRLQTKIQEQIEKGQWNPGECIPPERSLVKIYKVTMGAVFSVKYRR